MFQDGMMGLYIHTHTHRDISTRTLELLHSHLFTKNIHFPRFCSANISPRALGSVSRRLSIPLYVQVANSLINVAGLGIVTAFCVRLQHCKWVSIHCGIYRKFCVAINSVRPFDSLLNHRWTTEERRNLRRADKARYK